MDYDKRNPQGGEKALERREAVELMFEAAILGTVNDASLEARFPEQWEHILVAEQNADLDPYVTEMAKCHPITLFAVCELLSEVPLDELLDRPEWDPAYGTVIDLVDNKIAATTAKLINGEAEYLIRLTADEAKVMRCFEAVLSGKIGVSDYAECFENEAQFRRLMRVIERKDIDEQLLDVARRIREEK